MSSVCILREYYVSNGRLWYADCGCIVWMLHDQCSIAMWLWW